jgi:hypothetical protein
MRCEHLPALRVSSGGCPSDDLDFGNLSPPLMGKYEGDSRSSPFPNVIYTQPYGDLDEYGEDSLAHGLVQH